MNNPKIVKKNSENEIGYGISTDLDNTVSVPFGINGPGEVKVSIFKSSDSGGNGGFVLRIDMDKQDSGFQPHAINGDGFVEIHVAGSIEASSTIKALKNAISNLKIY